MTTGAFDVMERVPKALRPRLPVLLDWYGGGAADE